MSMRRLTCTTAVLFLSAAAAPVSTAAPPADSFSEGKSITMVIAGTPPGAYNVTGRSATNAIYPTVLNNVLGTKFKVVTGYEGSAAAMLAMERGEVEGHSSTYDGLKNQHEDWIRTRKVNILVQYFLMRHPDLPE